MGNVGWTELLLIFLVILLVFGAKRIPEIARGLGKGIREFKDATSDIKKELTVGDQPAPPPGQLGRPGYPQGYPQQYGPPATPDQMGYVPPPSAPYTPPAPGQQPFPNPAAPAPAAPGTPPAAPPAEGQTPQS